MINPLRPDAQLPPRLATVRDEIAAREKPDPYAEEVNRLVAEYIRRRLEEIRRES